ncbi:aminoacetone oxidase family FAD-binding enzyme [Cerasicoccus fimbriatus]|uniref:aminoacetone oxidase family FAD-binding enzyme n=1 Tax=Cerasicoccus fimbriatus TaxID=3014554 RepID=UPI0022B56525|nr:aminoacetone oxidase family FAD-binding enzyme [Cerasicoccus sp. TK19100]
MSDTPPPHIIVVGADPAGVFAAISAATNNPEAKVTLLAEDTLLPTWRNSEPFCCGLTREIWDPAELVSHLVAGEKEMIGPFTRYGPGDFETWLEENGQALDIDAEGRAHISGANTQDIESFFVAQLKACSVEIKEQAPLRAVDVKSTGGFWITLADERTLQADRLIIAGGGLISSPLRRVITTDFKHDITECFPALTGFQTVDDPRLRGITGALPGQRELRIGETDRAATGRITLEPWGVSGPATWELSARQTEYLHKLQNRFPLRISWLPGGSRAAAKLIDEQLRQFPNGKIGALEHERLPSRLWHNLLNAAKLDTEQSWDSLTPPQRSALVRELASGDYEVVKKKNVRGVSSVLGGVASEQIDFRTLASRLVPDLYFAGDVLNATAVSPELNLQIDWTTGWIAGAQAAGDNQ